MHIKTTRNHLTPISMATAENKTENKWWQECRETGTPVNHCWECKMTHSVPVPQKIKNTITI